MARAPISHEIEELPEADRLDGFLHPRETAGAALYGHEKAEAALAQAFASGRMHHGWLITGPEGIGKATLAYRFAMHALADPSERDSLGASLAVPAESRAARQVVALSHPGLLVIRRSWDFKTKKLSTVVNVDEVRRLRSFLAHSAADAGWRVIVVDTADDMNTNAANALLKSLEEPPPRTIFLLLSSAHGRLLPTIRSRCRTLDLAPLQPAPLRAAVAAAFRGAEKEPPSEAEWPVLERLAGGSVRRAISLSGSGGLKLYERVRAQFGELPKVDWGGVHTLADELALAANEQRFELWKDMALDAMARAIRAAATGEGAPEDVDLARRLGLKDRLASFAALWETVLAEMAQADALNLDKKALILDIFSRLAAATR
jgi:DNA polymerase-3 subunit delta'